MAKRAIRTKKYDSFRGVDFSTDPALVDDTRSPAAPNMISDMGGMPEKRPGWRTVIRGLPGRVNGLFSAVFGAYRHLLVHAGTKLYYWRTDGLLPGYLQLMDGLPDARSTAVFMGGYLWIFTGAVLIRYNGSTAAAASASAYIPLTLISRSPSQGGGVPHESVNLLGGAQTVGFLADGTAEYLLPYQNVTSVSLVTVDGVTVPAAGYTVDLTAGKVTFASAPAAPAAGAEDNVFITFSVASHADRINKCRTAAVWGVNGSFDRIIASGNPDLPNTDFTSAFNDGTYWPDTSYQTAGTGATAIAGYLRLGEYLAVIKNDNGQDSTVFLRSGALDEDGEAVFSTKPCLSGAGAVSIFAFGHIDDEQLILTSSGVYALTVNSLTAERIAQNRSFRVDPRLTKEDLSDAVCASFDGRFMVFVGGHVYILDGRQPKSRGENSFAYECFYWDNVPARCVLAVEEGGRKELFFGTEDPAEGGAVGRICRFNTDLEGSDRFCDEDGDGEPVAITASWSTKADDDGDPMVLKTLLKKGCAVTIKPYNRSSARVYFRTDAEAAPRQAAYGTMDIFDWEDIDFARFTFNANDAPAEIPFNRKVKNYKRLQFIIENDAPGEGFGVYGVTKHFVSGNFAKK